MEKNEMREVIAKRAAKELHDGDVVNLGIGIPTLIPNYLPEGVTVTLQTENGAMGMGPTPEPGQEDKNLINAVFQALCPRFSLSFVCVWE